MSRIWLPPGVLEDEHPTMTCRICKAGFRPGQERVYQAHVGRCFHEHRDELMALSPSARYRGTIFDEQATGDPEAQEHLERVGKQMVREGRWEMRPHERANV